MLPDVIRKVLDEEYPPLAELRTWKEPGLSAPSDFLGMQLEEAGGFCE